MATFTAPVTVVGATTWGTTLAIIMARRGISVRLLARTPDEARELAAAREHTRRLPGQPFPDSLGVTAAPYDALAGAAAVFVAVPSPTMRENAKRLVGTFADGTALISASKGLEPGTLNRMSAVLAEELPAARIGALSGPNLAREIVRDLPAPTVVASEDGEVCALVQRALSSPSLRVYTNEDLVGTEFGGALKNVIALGAGIVDGMGLGDNAKAGFVNRGLAEITRLGLAAGAQPATFAGLAGMGDLVATCYSALSRNHRVGVELARGGLLADVIVRLGGEVAEGVNTTPAALALAGTLGVEMPITELTNRVLFEGLSPRDAASLLMERTPKPE